MPDRQRLLSFYQPVEKRGCVRNMMFRSNMGFAESLVWEALRQLAVAWPKLKMATMAFFNRLLCQAEPDLHSCSKW